MPWMLSLVCHGKSQLVLVTRLLFLAILFWGIMQSSVDQFVAENKTKKNTKSFSTVS